MSLSVQIAQGMSATTVSGVSANTFTIGVAPLSKRKPSFLGTRVLVCGKVVRKLKGQTLICLLPPGVPHKVHSTLAIDDEGYLVLGHKTEDGKVTWQGVTTLDE